MDAEADALARGAQRFGKAPVNASGGHEVEEIDEEARLAEVNHVSSSRLNSLSLH